MTDQDQNLSNSRANENTLKEILSTKNIFKYYDIHKISLYHFGDVFISKWILVNIPLKKFYEK